MKVQEKPNSSANQLGSSSSNSSVGKANSTFMSRKTAMALDVKLLTGEHILQPKGSFPGGRSTITQLILSKNPGGDQKKCEKMRIVVVVLVMLVMIMSSCLATSRSLNNYEQQPGGTRTVDNHHYMSREEFNNNYGGGGDVTPKEVNTDAGKF
ncbi:hypothetical protein K7X08_031976 [Anisodus acutangulus]|uniref:Transmembrane protein n=1 Tax=Anisodus acutangulus TaxID=402998 RepID=A0A9Q1RMN1_9SOLA|nr:hypothetical protein K7X08_031976 [Anisodus acutangulus]